MALDVILTPILVYLFYGLIVQRFAGREMCRGEGLCPYPPPHRGGDSSHSSITLGRRLVIAIGWGPMLINRIVRQFASLLLWTVRSLAPVHIRNGIAAFVRWVVQGT